MIDLKVEMEIICLLYVLQSGLTPLHLTAQEDRVSAAEVLAKHDANLDQQTKVPETEIPYSFMVDNSLISI